jgi:hypothetical protein
VLIAAGLVLIAAGVVLLWARDWVMRNVTRRSLGSLAPGYAATPRGYAVYAALVGDIGLVLIALGVEIAWLIVASIAVFIIGSAAAIAGEVVTYRALKR